MMTEDPERQAIANVLDEVKHLVTGPRAVTHGDALEQLGIAQRLFDMLNLDYTTPHVVRNAAMMVCVKLSRIACGQPNRDDWLDIIGYAAIATRALDYTNEEVPF